MLRINSILIITNKHSFTCFNQNIFLNLYTFSAVFCVLVECLSSIPPFLCTQKITPLRNSMIYANQEKGVES